MSSVLAVKTMVICAALVIAGCSSDGDHTAPGTTEGAPATAPATEATAPTTLPSFEIIVDSDFAPPPTDPLFSAGDIDTGLRPFIDLATEDLAMWLGVDAAEISTHSAVLVVWPDASLGCPLPDTQYPQLAIDGSIIELDHDGQIYRYHTGGQRGVFTCATPLTDAPPTVDDEGAGVEL